MNTKAAAAPPGAALFAAYLGEGRGTRHYLAAFESFAQRGRGRMRWNWAAFLFGFCWLLYRDMFFFAVVYLVLVGLALPYAIFFILQEVGAPVDWYWHAAQLQYGVVSLLVLPAFADWLYYVKVRNVIEDHRREAGDQADLLDRLSKKPRFGRIGLAILAIGCIGMLVVGLYAARDIVIRNAVGDAKASFDIFYLPSLEAYYREHGRWPRSSAEMPARPTGLALPGRSLVFVSEGRFRVDFGKSSHMDDLQMFITVRRHGEKIRSRCELTGLPEAKVPLVCRRRESTS